MPVTFTVVIPTHNRRDRLLQAIASVRNQSREAQQIIVVADGCTDDSVAAVHGLGDPLIEVLDLPKAPRKGWALRNQALAIATGDVISYLGDDDLYLPDHLERVGVLHDTGKFDFVQANTIVAWPDGQLRPMNLDWGVPELRRSFEAREKRANPMASGSHRKGLAEEAGGWSADPPPGVGGDEDLFRRMLTLDPATVFLSEPTVLIVNERFGSRAAEADALLAEMSTPAGLALIRARSNTEGNRAAAQLESSVAELQIRAETYDRIVAGRWWRLRRRLDPLVRIFRR